MLSNISSPTAIPVTAAKITKATKDLPTQFRKRIMAVRQAEHFSSKDKLFSIALKSWVGFKLVGQEFYCGGTAYMSKEKSRHRYIQNRNVCADAVIGHSVIADRMAIQIPSPEIITRGNFLTLHYDGKNKFHLVENSDLESDKLMSKDNQHWQEGILDTLNTFPLRIDTLHAQRFIDQTRQIRLGDDASRLTTAHAGILRFLECAKSLTHLLRMVEKKPDSIDMQSEPGQHILNSIVEYRQARRDAKRVCKELGIHTYSNKERYIRMMEGLAFIARGSYSPVKLPIAIAGVISLVEDISTSYADSSECTCTLLENESKSDNATLIEAPLKPVSDVLHDNTASELSHSTNAPEQETVATDEQTATSRFLRAGENRPFITGKPVSIQCRVKMPGTDIQIANVNGCRLTGDTFWDNAIVQSYTPSQFANNIETMTASHLGASNWDQWTEVTTDQFTALLKRLGSDAAEILNGVADESQPWWAIFATQKTLRTFVCEWSKDVSEHAHAEVVDYLPERLQYHSRSWNNHAWINRVNAGRID